MSLLPGTADNNWFAELILCLSLLLVLRPQNFQMHEAGYSHTLNLKLWSPHGCTSRSCRVVVTECCACVWQTRIKMTNYDASPFQHDVAIQHARRKPANMTLQVYSEWRITILKANFVFLHATVSTKCKIQLGFGCTYQHWIKSHQNRWTIELLSPPPECTLNPCNPPLLQHYKRAYLYARWWCILYSVVNVYLFS